MDKAAEYLQLFIESSQLSFSDMSEEELIILTEKIRYIEDLGLARGYESLEGRYTGAYLTESGIKSIDDFKKTSDRSVK